MIEVRLVNVRFWVQPLDDDDGKQLVFRHEATDTNYVVPLYKEGGGYDFLMGEMEKSNDQLRKEVAEAQEKAAKEAARAAAP
jgi:hypothetical protein